MCVVVWVPVDELGVLDHLRRGRKERTGEMDVVALRVDGDAIMGRGEAKSGLR
jgi:hypothetical protein